MRLIQVIAQYDLIFRMSSRTLLRLACRSTATLSKINPAASAVLLPSRGFSGGRGQQDGRAGVGVAMAMGAGAVALALNQTKLKAEDDAIKDILDTENRIRQYSKPERIFDYFSSFQCLNSKGSIFLYILMKHFESFSHV